MPGTLVIATDLAVKRTKYLPSKKSTFNCVCVSGKAQEESIINIV